MKLQIFDKTSSTSVLEPFVFFVFIFWWNEAAQGPYAFLVRLYAFFQPYQFDAYGPQTGPFFLWFSKEIACGAVWVMKIQSNILPSDGPEILYFVLTNGGLNKFSMSF